MPGAAVGALIDADGCEVFEDNYELVADGALLTVTRAVAAPPAAQAPAP